MLIEGTCTDGLGRIFATGTTSKRTYLRRNGQTCWFRDSVLAESEENNARSVFIQFYWHFVRYRVTLTRERFTVAG